jgi:hypothetical protein
MTTTALDLAAMPTEADLREALKVVTSDLAGEMLGISNPVKRIAHFKGEKTPTLEDIGRLFVFVRDVEGALREVEGYLADVRNSLYELDYVRIHDNVDPDPPDNA